MRSTAALCLLVPVLLVPGLSACGSTPRSAPPVPPHSAAEREWVDNAYRFVDLLDTDIALAAAGGSTLATARQTLADVSGLYTALAAYTFFDACGHELANVGVPSLRVRRVVRTLASACGRLERASALFHQAVTRNDAALLVRAARVDGSAEPLLGKARAELAAVA